MNHDMSRYELENGPDEPRLVPCWPLLTAPCRTCDTDGEIPVDEMDDER